MNNNVFSISALKEYTSANRLPFMLHWNITEKCNLRCTHCCVPKRPVTVSLEDANEIIKFIKENGFFLITLSGGECLTHPNFKEIYLGLKRAGVYISVFTNGTTLTPEIKELFVEYKPRKVEVSVYGYDEKSFYETTGSKRGYKEFLDTLDFLKENEIRTIIKAPITKKNMDHLDDFIQLSEQYNAQYKFGTFIFPMLDGDLSPLEERLDYRRAVEIEFNDCDAIKGFCRRANEKGTVGEPFVSKCSACNNSYTLNADNSFSFCGMMTEPKLYFNQEVPVQEAFEKVTAFRDEIIKVYEEGPCNSCRWANVCPGCPAHLQLEMGSMYQCNPYFYDITKEKLGVAIERGLVDPGFLEK